MVPRSINWLAVMLAAFTLLSVSVESCVAAKVVIEEDQPHALVAQDQHQDLGKPTWITQAPGFVCPDMPHLPLESPRAAAGKTVTTRMACRQAPAGVHRHRWLCVERC